MFKTLKNVLSDNQGQGLAEYGLILALVSIAAYTTLNTLGGTISTVFTNVNADL
jgi:pilus assembly protein Flp/PilA